MGDCYGQLFIFVPFLLLLYFLMIRPQQKQEKARRAMLAAVQKNDRVVTTGGIHGTVASLSEREAVLKLDSEGKMRITVDRSAIGRVMRDEPRESDTGAGKDV
jgi:preprotein translocase subunit YajC